MLVIGAVEKYILGAMLAIGVGVMGAFSTGPGGMMQTDEAAFVEAHQGPRIVVVEAWSCGWCRELRKELAPLYQESSYQARVPLTYAHINGWAVKKLNLRRPVSATPTVLLVDQDGNEMIRMTGYPGDIGNMYRMVDKYAPPQS